MYSRENIPLLSQQTRSSTIFRLRLHNSANLSTQLGWRHNWRCKARVYFSALAFQHKMIAIDTTCPREIIRRSLFPHCRKHTPCKPSACSICVYSTATTSHHSRNGSNHEQMGHTSSTDPFNPCVNRTSSFPATTQSLHLCAYALPEPPLLLAAEGLPRQLFLARDAPQIFILPGQPPRHSRRPKELSLPPSQGDRSPCGSSDRNQ